LIRAGRLLGVPLSVGSSWVVLVPVVGWAIFAGIPGDLGSTGARMLVAGLGTALLFFSIVVHELGHVVAARVLGLPVREVVVFLMGGYTDMDLDSAPPLAEARVALVGPATSATLVVVLWVLSLALPEAAGLRHVAEILVLVNGAVAFFNLAPVAPLDGGRILRGNLRASGWNAVRAERLGALLGIVLGVALLAGGAWAERVGSGLTVLAVPSGLLLLLLGLWALLSLRR
jgi:Zn-dependent protease